MESQGKEQAKVKQTPNPIRSRVKTKAQPEYMHSQDQEGNATGKQGQKQGAKERGGRQRKVEEAKRYYGKGSVY